MRKILYITYINEDLRPGYQLKIYGQVQALSDLNNNKDVFLGIIGLEGYKVYNFLKHEKKVVYLQKYKRIISEQKNYIDDFFLLYKYLKGMKNFIIKEKINVVYIRRILPITPILLKFLTFLKNNKIEIIYEYPTYPWEKEMKKTNRFLYYLDKIQYNNLISKINSLVIISDKNYVSTKNLNIIRIENAISIKNIKLINKNYSDEIRFIIVAGIAFWHGIDRFLYSLLEYSKDSVKDKVRFHIVGEGKEVINLKKIVKHNKELQNIVIFHGFKKGKDLERIYNNSDIGVGSLGNFRKGLIEDGGGLKNQEYCAKGIPFIIAGKDSNFKNCNFVYNVPNDNSLINIKEVIEWYKNLNINSEEIRKYAVDNLSWNIQMEKVIKNIK